MDLDAFFVEVCRQRQPELRDEPLLIVGGRRDGRGVVQSASYGARAFGVRFVFTEREPASRAMLLRRGFAVSPGERVLIVEDVITTGGSTREVIAHLLAIGAKVLAAASIIDRSGGTAQVGVPRIALATLEATTYDAANCPLCAQGTPVEKPGSRPAITF